MIETVKTTKILVKEGFKVMVIALMTLLAKNQRIMAHQLLCLTLIGSGLGLQNKVNISLIVKQSKVPVIVDAGIGTALMQLL